MRFVAIADDGTEIELKEVQGLDKDADVVIMTLIGLIRMDSIPKVEQELSKKIGKRVVLLPPIVGEVMTL